MQVVVVERLILVQVLLVLVAPVGLVVAVLEVRVQERLEQLILAAVAVVQVQL
jgi:hypothetical protein